MNRKSDSTHSTHSARKDRSRDTNSKAQAQARKQARKRKAFEQAAQ